MQHDASDCAAAALASICKHYKKELSIMRIREVIGTDAYGTTVYGLVNGAKELGFDARAVKILIENVSDEYTLPAIAHVITEDGLSHFIVINKIERDKFIVSDPERGIITYSKEDFQKIFSGVLILLVPTSQFEQLDYQKTTMLSVFKALIFPQKKLLTVIIMSSFALAIIGIVSSLFSKVLFDEIIPYQLKNTLFMYVILFGLISVAQLFLSAFRQHVLLFLSRKIDIPVLLGYYNHILKLPYHFFSTRRVGDILTRFQDAMTIKDIFSQVSISLVLDIVLAFITGIVLWNINSKLFGIILIMVILNIILIYMFKKRYKTLNYEQMNAASIMNSQLIESMKNIEVVKSYHDEAQQIEQLENKFIKVLKLGYEEGILSNIQGTVSSGIGTIGNLIFMSIGALAIINGDMSMGDLIAFQTLSGYFIEPIQNLVSLQLTFQEAQIAMKRLNEIMEIEPEQSDTNPLLENIDIQGDITFHDVTFRYGSRSPVLANFNMTIPVGKKVAIVGESGAGKSTVAKLLMKFYEVEEGEISINSYDLKDVNTYSLRQKIGYVPQNVELFSGKVIDNIKVGYPEATYEQVVSACRRAGCHEFIQKIPGRYYGFIEENGGNLSGGERQRIAIARALLQERQIYIFDESTSNLDSFSEKFVQEMMIERTRGTTTLIIAHRLSTIIHCDEIMFMENGQVLECGTHEELLEMSGKYRQMIDLQYGNSTARKTNNISKEIEEEVVYD